MDNTETHTRTAFFATPIGSPGDEVRQRADDLFDLISEVVRGEGMDLVRADRMQDPGRITSQIVRAINDAAVVIADLKGPNPNVMYEVGVADTLGRPVVAIVDDVSDLPFDRRAERALPVESMHYKQAQKFKAALKEAIQKAVEASGRGGLPDNPVTQAGIEAQLESRAGSDTEVDALLQIQAEIGSLARDVRRIQTEISRERRVSRVSESRRTPDRIDHLERNLVRSMATGDVETASSRRPG